MLWPVVLVPLIHGDEVASGIAGWAGRGIKSGAIFCVGGEALGHLVVDFQDASLGAVFSVFLFVFAFYDGEGLHDVLHRLAGSGKVSGEGRIVSGKW